MPARSIACSASRSGGPLDNTGLEREDAFYIQRRPAQARLPPAAELLDRLPQAVWLGGDPTVPVDHAGWLSAGHPPTLAVAGDASRQWLNSLDDSSRAALPARLHDAGLRALLWAGTEPDATADTWTRAFTAAGIAVARSPAPAALCVHRLRETLVAQRAPRAVIYGVFVRVFGLGVFISGQAGIGKSELALELLSRGHTLVADDAVELLRLPGPLLIGRPPELLEGFLEVRGLGILDVRRMYGNEALSASARVDFILHLVPFGDAPVDYRARLAGLRSERELLGLAVPEVSLPVRVGHNLATLVEAASRDQWLRLRGIEADVEFAARHQQAIDAAPRGT